MSLPAQRFELIGTLEFQKKGPKITKKERRCRPGASKGGSTPSNFKKKGRKSPKKNVAADPALPADPRPRISKKRAENHQKRMSLPARRCQRIDDLNFKKKGRKSPKKNVAAGPALPADPRPRISEKRAENHQKRTSLPARRCQRIDDLNFKKKGRK